MASFEEALSYRVPIGSKDGESAATDLDYISKPENYSGAALNLQTFMYQAQKGRPQTEPNSSEEDKPTSHQLQRKNSCPLGAPLEANVEEDEDTDDEAFLPERPRVRSRIGSVQISSRKGSIQLEIRSIRKVAQSSTYGDRTRKHSAGTSATPPVQEQTNGDVMTHEERWRATADAVSVRRVSSVIGVPTTAHRSERSEEEQIVWARNRFRHAIKTVLILLKWISSLTEKEESEDERGHGRTFTDIASEAFTSDTGLSFDVSQFKANREINISNEVKSILSIPSHTRSAEQLQTALYGLQHLKSFAEYPLHMQEKLCKVAWFQQVPPKRMIIRQGHYAENFYFILAGQALVRILEKNPKTGEPQLRTAAIMKKGTSFGELALLHHSRRTATVVSQDSIQLLTIGRDDFFDIFMGGNSPGEIPEHIKFCKSLDFLKDWPIDKLLENPQHCLFHFFKRGVVIVPDSNKSEWIYIIKSGSCRVMKQLHGVVPQVGGTRLSKQRHNVCPSLLPTLLDERTEPKVDTGLKRPHTRARAGRTPTPIQQARRQYQNMYAKQPHLTSQSTSHPTSHPTSHQDDRGSISANQQQGFSKSRFKLFAVSQRAHFMKPTNEQRLSNMLVDKPERRPLAVLDRVKEERQLVEQLALRGPVFVNVEVLKPKDVFGLSSVKFDDDVETSRTSVSLVSNGAECIMFSKKFFKAHATELVKKLVRHQIRHYPTELSLQDNLQCKVDWDLYKKRLIRDTIGTRHIGTLAPV